MSGREDWPETPAGIEYAETRPGFYAEARPGPAEAADLEVSGRDESGPDEPPEPAAPAVNGARAFRNGQAADQFEAPSERSRSLRPVSAGQEAAVIIAAELAARTRIVESASADDPPAPINAAPLQARPIREAAIQIIQTGRPPVPDEARVEEQTALVRPLGQKEGRDQLSLPENEDESADSRSLFGEEDDWDASRLVQSLAEAGEPQPGERPEEKTALAWPLWESPDRPPLFRVPEPEEEDSLSVESVDLSPEDWPDEVEESGLGKEEERRPAPLVRPAAPVPAPSLNIRPDLGVACFSPALMKIPHLETFLGHRPVFQPVADRGLGAVITWGREDNLAARRALMFARKYGLPLWRLADGFLGLEGPAPMSLAADRSGIYYDANQPSDLEKLLNSTGWETPELLAAAEKALRLIKENFLSKFNLGRPAPEGVLSGGRRRRKRILVVDQARGDLSVNFGLGGPESFQAMLKAARYEHPGEEFFIKTHPEVLTGRKTGYFDLRRQTGLTIINEDFTPLSLLAQADEVYTVSSLMGLEALFLDKPVHCFGLPFYAGWGLTQDRLSTPRRVRERTLPELFAAAYLLYLRYVNPVTGRAADVFEIIRLLADQRRQRQAARGFRAVGGFSFWERERVRSFFAGDAGGPVFTRTPGWARRLARRRRGRLALRDELALLPNFDPAEYPEATWVSDGLLPAPVPDSEFRPSSSLILDQEGLYWDPARSSRLEQILKDFDFNAHPELVYRAEALIKSLLDLSPGPERARQILAKSSTPLPAGRRVILVPGQTAGGSAAPFRSSPEFPGDADLLAEVRRRRPEGFIIYQPGPGRESGGVPGQALPADPAGTPVDPAAPSIDPTIAPPTDHPPVPAADLVAAGTELSVLLALADEVHTLSSPAGFEALLRGLETHTYGGPFYAGWQLTTDRLDFPRRGRRLSAAELAAGALILYPCYYDWRSKLFCGPEEILHLLGRGEATPDLKIKILLAARNLIRKLFPRLAG